MRHEQFKWPTQVLKGGVCHAGCVHAPAQLKGLSVAVAAVTVLSDNNDSYAQPQWVDRQTPPWLCGGVVPTVSTTGSGILKPGSGRVVCKCATS